MSKSVVKPGYPEFDKLVTHIKSLANAKEMRPLQLKNSAVVAGLKKPNDYYVGKAIKEALGEVTKRPYSERKKKRVVTSEPVRLKKPKAKKIAKITTRTFKVAETGTTRKKSVVGVKLRDKDAYDLAQVREVTGIVGGFDRVIALAHHLDGLQL